MQSDDSDVAVPVFIVLGLIIGLGVYNEVTREPVTPTQAQITKLLDAPKR